MKRLTTDHPKENFDTTLNYVFGKDGWAYIRSDGESEGPILLTEWARRQCITRGCDKLPTDPEGIDESISDCAFCAPECPVFLAYTFACQAVHLRDRLKQIEDILGDNYDLDHLERTERERDAAIADIYNMGGCPNCKYNSGRNHRTGLPICVKHMKFPDGKCFDWRGVEAALAEKGAENA